TSGAVSLWGMVGALAGALVVWMAALPYPMADETGLVSWAGGVAVVLGGVAASLADSLLGATVQVQYTDPATGAPTERPASESGAHAILRGRAWMGNDVVNLLCTACGAIFALIGYMLAT
ncbi:MAG TPA: DUF92 domain-containing protein, partial [Rhodothermales bacterium]|nr:DUF92 domain-containing protein [Rhodothermales bacterium]